LWPWYTKSNLRFYDYWFFKASYNVLNLSYFHISPLSIFLTVVIYFYHITIETHFKTCCRLIFHSHAFSVNLAALLKVYVSIPPIREGRFSDPIFWLYCWSKFTHHKRAAIPKIKYSVLILFSLGKVTFGLSLLVYNTCVFTLQTKALHLLML